MSHAICAFCGRENCEGQQCSNPLSEGNNFGTRLRPGASIGDSSLPTMTSSAKRARHSAPLPGFSYFSRPLGGKTRLVDLPDDALFALFDALPLNGYYALDPDKANKERATGTKHQCALMLASTCRRFSQFYRYQYVAILDLVPTAYGWADYVARTLERYPRVDRIQIAETGYRKQRLDFRKALTFRGEPGPGRIRAIDVPPLSIQADIEALYELCPQLNYMSVPYNFAANSGMVTLLRGLPDTLLHLRLVGLTSGHVGDEDGVRIGSLQGLEELHLERCSGLASQTCSSLSNLKTLKRLSISRCPNLNDHLPGALDGMTSLQTLHLAQQTLSLRLLQALPRAIRDLDLSGSDFVENELNTALFARLDSLRSLKIGFYLETWGPLRGLAPSLVTLTLPLCSQLTDHFSGLALYRLRNLRNLIIVDDMDEGGALISDQTMAEICKLPSLSNLSVESSLLTDEGTAESLRNMATASLARLNLSGCEKLADETAAAVANIRNLEHCDLSFTSVTLHGVLELGAGAILTTLLSLDLSNCIRILNRAWAVDIIKEAGFLKRDFFFFFDFEVIDGADAVMQQEEEEEGVGDEEDESDDDVEIAEEEVINLGEEVDVNAADGGQSPPEDIA